LGEANSGADDEDTEEEIEALLKEAEAACANLPTGSEQVKLVSALLLKVRGFIAKVCSKLPKATLKSYHNGRFDDLRKPRSILRNVVRMRSMKSSSFFLTARPDGAHGTA